MPRIPNLDGLMFPTVSGKRIEKGSLRYYWDPVRSAFRQTVPAERWAALCEGQQDLDSTTSGTFASLIVDRGGDEYDVAAQLGNTPEVCRRTYIHSYKDRHRTGWASSTSRRPSSTLARGVGRVATGWQMTLYAGNSYPGALPSSRQH